MAVTKGVLLLLLYISHTSAKCGIQNVNIQETSEESLVGGQEFPWVVSLQDPQYTHLAFGCVLSEFWILSIASAFQNRKEAVAIVGIARMDSKEVSHEEFPVSFIVPHEDFDNSTMDNNIALLKTDTAMAFTSLVRPICFLNKGTAASPHLRNCWVAGWNPTTATGNHMTMSILRKITVRDMEPCPLNHSRKLRCGNHIERETNSVCLGDPGNPVMCQMQQVNLWVLRGLLSPGGEKCPGLFLYTRIDEYGAWIEAKTKGTASALTSFHQWDHFVPSPSFSSRAPAAQKKFPGLARMMGSQTQPRSLKSVTRPSWSANDSSRSIQDRDKGFKPAIQPMYYDYYGGVEGGEVVHLGPRPAAPAPRAAPALLQAGRLGRGRLGTHSPGGSRGSSEHQAPGTCRAVFSIFDRRACTWDRPGGVRRSLLRPTPTGPKATGICASELNVG